MKTIPPNEAARLLYETGLLFELNRKVLHPHGLALEVVLGEDGRFYLGGLLDCRDDPEGLVFDPGTFAEGRAKLDRYLRQDGAFRIAARLRALGFEVQDEPGRAG